MEPANEETGLVPRPSSPSQSSASNPRPDSPTAAASSSDGVSASNGSFLPQARNNSSHASPKDRPVSGIVPPYWTHHRNASRASQSSLDRFPAITLEDHTEDPNSETSRGLWARSVSVNDHVVVQGKTGIGSYVVWNCTIQTLEGGPITIHTPNSTTYENNSSPHFHMQRTLSQLSPRRASSTNSVPHSSNPGELD
ncbi:hypothetical protein N8T08_001663 [Aspergillus melleus]|uniref:Uncharacterized protein n=1 Tax=Aspergillus melleus TaxID=138277 RepID=A0ACC3AMY3_9EURO|nr:hypothetical protein N8T08_001663 [Aspergillus melleus]